MSVLAADRDGVLVLSGPPGVGKSSVGRHLAQRTGRELVDLDQAVAAAAGMSVPEILARQGEAQLREWERRAMSELAPARAVVALGGGTLTTPHGRRLARGLGPVLGLEASLATLEARLSGSEIPRPLLADIGLPRLLEARRESYAAIDRRVPAEGRVDEVTARVEASSAELHVRTAKIAGRRTRVLVGRELDDAVAGAVAAQAPGRPVLAVVDRGVPAARAERTLSAVARLFPLTVVRLQGGEDAKRFERLGEVLQTALDAGCGRQSVVLGLGGGAVLDLSALVASLLGRGAGLVLVPTTLLAQVDASVGGKCAVNARAGRNLIGAFYPAADVVVDLSFLESLSVEEHRSGMAELVKIAALADRALFERLERTRTAEVPEVLRAIEAKLAVVELDPEEQGLRRVLNFGHTLGHALESASAFTLRHGEAVAIGMCAILRLGVRRGWTPAPVAERVIKLIEALGLPTRAEPALLEGSRAHLGADKKADLSGVELVVVPELGKSEQKRVLWTEVEDLVRCGGAT